MNDLEEWIRIKVRFRIRAAVRRYILPGLLIAGGGVVVALYMVWLDAQEDKQDQCELRIEARVNFRSFAAGQYDQWDDILDIFPQDSDNVIAIRAINDARRAQTAEDYPPLTEETAGCP
jgi:hypothetical protein